MLGRNATGSAASIQTPRASRRGQIPIAPAAPSLPHTPRFRALALLGRRLPSTWMASAFRRPRNLHTSGHRVCGSNDVLKRATCWPLFLLVRCVDLIFCHALQGLSLIHISEPTRLGMISYAVFCLK